MDYKTEIEFLKKYGLMLIKEENLRNLKDIFVNPNLTGLMFNLNNSMEKEYVGREESISTREKKMALLSSSTGSRASWKGSNARPVAKILPIQRSVTSQTSSSWGSPIFFPTMKKRSFSMPFRTLR